MPPQGCAPQICPLCQRKIKQGTSGGESLTAQAALAHPAEGGGSLCGPTPPKERGRGLRPLEKGPGDVWPGEVTNQLWEHRGEDDEVARVELIPKSWGGCTVPELSLAEGPLLCACSSICLPSPFLTWHLLDQQQKTTPIQTYLSFLPMSSKYCQHPLCKWIGLMVKSSRLLDLVTPKCGPWTLGISIPRRLIRNAEPWAPPKTKESASAF